MRVETDEAVWEMPEGRDLYFWVPERVPECPHRACRRARKCVRAEVLPHRRLLGLPSCRMTTDREWAVWTDWMLRVAFGPRKNLGKDLQAIGKKHLEAARREWAAQGR